MEKGKGICYDESEKNEKERRMESEKSKEEENIKIVTDPTGKLVEPRRIEDPTKGLVESEVIGEDNKTEETDYLLDFIILTLNILLMIYNIFNFKNNNNCINTVSMISSIIVFIISIITLLLTILMCCSGIYEKTETCRVTIVNNLLENGKVLTQKHIQKFNYTSLGVQIAGLIIVNVLFLIKK